MPAPARPAGSGRTRSPKPDTLPPAAGPGPSQPPTPRARPSDRHRQNHQIPSPRPTPGPATVPATGKLHKSQSLVLLAAFLGWLFDGLDGYLYVMVAMPLVAKLLDVPQSDPSVAGKAGIIQGFFLIGWAIGGAIFG